MKTRSAALAVLVVLVICLIPLLPACGGDEDEVTINPGVKPSPSQTETVPPTSPAPPPTTPTETYTVTIGNHTDITGVAANALKYIDMALEDVVEYYNENNDPETAVLTIGNTTVSGNTITGAPGVNSGIYLYVDNATDGILSEPRLSEITLSLHLTPVYMLSCSTRTISP